MCSGAGGRRGGRVPFLAQAGPPLACTLARAPMAASAAEQRLQGVPGVRDGAPGGCWQVHKLAEQDRERGRLSQPRWMLGEGRWQTKPDREKAIARQPSAAALAQAFSFANSPSVLRGGA